MLIPQIYTAQVNGVRKEVKVFHKQMAVEYFRCYQNDIMYRDVKRVIEADNNAIDANISSAEQDQHDNWIHKQ
jgi:hypothetical protein